MNSKYKLMVILSIFALAFAGIAVMDDSEESDAATARTWTVGTEVHEALMPGVAYGVMPNSIPGITFSIVYISAQLPEAIAADGTPTTPGTWVLYAFNEDQSVRDTMTITVHATNVTISTATDGHGTATGGGTYNVGDSVTLSASPNSGYEFYQWQSDGSTYSSNPYTFTVTQTFADAWPNGITYTAKFRSITPSDYSVTVYPGNYSYFYWPTGQDTTHYTSAHTYTVDAGTFFNIYWIGNSSSSGGSNPSWVTNYSDCTTMATSSGYPGTGVDYAYINSNSTFYPATAMTYSTTYTHYYTLHYNANGGTGAPSDSNGTVTNSSSAAVSKNMTISSTEPTRSGYTFLGWSTSSSATTASYQPGQTYSFSRGTTDLYAVWQESIPTYTVTFTVNNSTYGFVSTPSITVDGGTTYYTEHNVFYFGTSGRVYAMTNNPPAGYTYQFDHWSSDSGTINSDMTITAYFTSSALYTVSFVSSNPLVGTVSQSTISNVPDGSGITVYNDGSLSIYGTGVTVTATATDSNWYFDGWYIGSTQVQTGFTITADTTITAKFSSYGIQHGTAENPLNGISYSPFALWYETDKTYYVKGNSAVDLQKYTILNNTYSVTNVTSGTGLTISNGSLTGNITGDATVTIQQQNQQSTTTQTITLYAIYPPCDITITAGSGGSVNTNSLTVPYGSSWSTYLRQLTIDGTTITATANTGYVFAGWSPTGSGTITEDTTFTASFDITNYVVNFLKSPNDGGYITPGQIVTVDYGTTYTVDNTNGTIVLGGTTYTAVVNSGYSFGGWTDSGSAAVSGTITANKTFTANFTANNYTVTFDANGGTVSPTSKTVTYNDWYGQLPTPTYTGHTFTGWYTEQTGGTQVTSGTIVTTASNHTLWAHWDDIVFTVTIYPDPFVGTVSPSTVQNVPYGTVITVSGNTLDINGTTVTATATAPDWYFNEWQNVSGPITADRTITAKFTTPGIDHGTRENPLNGITYSIGTLWYQENKTYYVKAGTLVDMDKFIVLNTTYSAINVTSGTGISVVDGELYGTITENATVTIQEQNQQSTSTQTINIVCVYLPLTVNVVSGGHGTVTGSGVYEVGETVTITGTPDQDYAFMRWTMQGGSTSANPWVFVVDRMVSGQTYNITGEFAKSVTDVTVTVSGEHGQVKVNDGVPSLQVSFRAYITGVLTQQGITVSGNTASFPYSTVQNVIAIPEAGYSAVWSVQNGAPVTDNMEVTLSFERTVYTISASSSLAVGGQVQIENFNQSTSAGPGTSETLTAYYGDTVQLTAIPSTGYHLDKWTKNGLMYVDSLVFTITVTSNETFEAVFEATVITVTFDPTGGTVSPTSKTVSYGQAYGQLPTPTRYGFEFLGWFTDAAVGDKIQADTIVRIDQAHTLYAHWMEQMPDVFWWNDYVNGSIDIAFDFTGLADSRLHVMYIPLYSYNSSTETDLENDPHGLNQFDQTGYTLRISCGYNTDLTLAIYQNGILHGEIYTYKIGMWDQYALEINAQTGKIIFKGIHALMDRSIQFTFMNYKVVMSVTAIDFSDRITGLAFEKVYHADTGTGAHPSFQVSSTMTYLNTYGFVLVDPSINIYEQFPNYDNLRLNFYSFVYYGDSMTVNGHTIQLSDFGLLDLWYVPKNTPIYNDQQQIIGYTTENAISDPSDPRAIEQKIELQNIFVTWNNLHSQTESDRTCYLTFVDGKLEIAMGTFDIGDLEVSFSGVWYFTTMLYEPYIGKEISYEMDWNSWFNMDANAFILVYIALSVVFFIIANRFYQPGFLDYIVVGGAGLISYILLGGF